MKARGHVPAAVLGALDTFAEELRRNFHAAVDAQPEDQLKGPVQTLLKALGKAMNSQVESRSEVRPHDVSGRPDVGVLVGGALAGYVELKAPGRGANPERFKGADKTQWAKFQALPNLIYTDGNEWTLYRAGERRGEPVRLGGDLTAGGASALASESAGQLADLIRDFLLWEPIVPTSPKALAEVLAPLCRLLREEVLSAVRLPDSVIARAAEEWREALFPSAADEQFADAYAQTVTYGLLLARFEGEENVRTYTAERTLERKHGLLARALRLLSDPQVRAEIELGIELLERSISAIDLRGLRTRTNDPWLYFYEDFLAEYDPKLRASRGVYYTPVEVIRLQCRLVEELLEKAFQKRLGFADDDVVVLDPAAGTGAYLLAAFQMGCDRVAERLGPGAVAGRAAVMAADIHAFEVLVGPYAVAHLRLTQAITTAGSELPEDGVHVYLTDTLESPHAKPLSKLSFMLDPLADEHRRAQRVKAETRVLVCLGNPPYYRQQRSPEDEKAGEREGGWIRYGEHGGDALLNDFLEPARKADKGVHLKNLYNAYVYFWRWALWKVFETTQGPGLVSFITASSYLRGPGFIGMRQVLREILDEIWIIDLEGDSQGPRKTENVFAIQTPVAIAVGVRYGEPRKSDPARVWYSKLEGSRESKLRQLDAASGFRELQWKECYSGWMDYFLPQSDVEYFSWPALTDIFPWQHSGIQFKRTWPIAETRQLLEERWKIFVNAPRDKATLFRETPARRIDHSYKSIDEPGAQLLPLSKVDRSSAAPGMSRYAYRSFDRQWALLDPRFADRVRPSMLRAHSGRQIYLTSLLTNVLGDGPAATVSAHPPDLHHFRGSYGAADVIPLYRDATASKPNVTGGLLKALEHAYQRPVSPESFLAYCYALLATPSFVNRFWDELTIPGPRIPITRSEALFRHVAEIGQRLILLHTYGERLSATGSPMAVPTGTSRCTKAVPGHPAAYPEGFEYDGETQTLMVGGGAFTPVSLAVWRYSISGFEVVGSWLAERMKKGAGKRSSPLDDVRPERWTAHMTEELLELLWVLEATIDLTPDLDRLLETVVTGPVFLASELPAPSVDERKALEEDDSEPEPDLQLMLG